MPILMYLVGVITAYRLPELLLPTIIYLSMHQALVFYIKAFTTALFMIFFTFFVHEKLGHFITAYLFFGMIREECLLIYYTL